jgi:CheY-like chemotaxis protein
MKTLRHPPSRELWKFCMERLRELRGPDTRERDLANMLGFEHSRAVRWKEGQMYVDRAEYLVRLADALEVETMLLVALASGTLTAEQAQRQLGRVARADGRGDDGKRRRAGPGPRGEPTEVSQDASLFAVDAARLEASARGVVLLIASSGEGRSELGDALGRHADTAGLVAAGFSMGLMLAERYRPELVFLDLGVAGVHAFEACRALSSLTSRSQRRCRVIAGTATLIDGVEKPALMAGASNVTLFPFPPNLFESELDRLEERLGPRRVARERSERR